MTSFALDHYMSDPSFEPEMPKVEVTDAIAMINFLTWVRRFSMNMAEKLGRTDSALKNEAEGLAAAADAHLREFQRAFENL